MYSDKEICMNEQKIKNIHSIDSVFFKRKKGDYIHFTEQRVHIQKKGFPKYVVMFKCS